MAGIDPADLLDQRVGQRGLSDPVPPATMMFSRLATALLRPLALLAGHHALVHVVIQGQRLA